MFWGLNVKNITITLMKRLLMLSLTKPTLQQQTEIAIQTQLGDWFANPNMGSELHKVNQLKTKAVAHLPVEVETWKEGNEFQYRITEVVQ